MTLKLENVDVFVGNSKIVEHINLHVEKGKFVGIVGLNGSGKSSLLKAVYGVNNYEGDIFLYNENIKNISIKQRAKKMAVLIQENTADFDFRVKDIVMLGRLPYHSLLEGDSDDDEAIVEKALLYVGMKDFKNRYFNTLSGGEKQRVLIARILAQQTNFLILDEPTNHLDIKNQFQFFELVKGLGVTVLAVLHDLNVAARFCDELYIIKDSNIYAHGKPDQVITEKLLSEVFGMKAKVHGQAGEQIFIEYLWTSNYSKN